MDEAAEDSHVDRERYICMDEPDMYQKPPV